MTTVSDDAEDLVTELEWVADVEVEAHEEVIADSYGGGCERGGEGECGGEIDAAVEGIERGVDGFDGDEERVRRCGRG